MIRPTNCCGCSACVNVCTKKCITMKEDKLGFFYPVCDNNQCNNCGLCTKVCPAIHKGKPSKAPYAWGGYSSNQEIRKGSSSGGIFSILAKLVIDNGGVVFGAAFSNDNRQIQHVCIDNADDLYKLRGSKYVQSNIGNTYSQVRKFLENDRSVMFSGTPCQIDGLRLYLGKDYDNLLTVEVICHGVPSPKIYKKYINYIEKKLGSTVKGVFFRDELGGGTLIMRVETINGSVYRKDKFTDPFFRLFLRNNCLRESCYDCPSRGLHERADITLSDFWGVESVSPDLVDCGGISLVLLHTDKGKNAFSKIKDECIGHEVDFNKAIEGNQSFYNSYTRPEERTNVEKDVDLLDFEKLYVKYGMSWKGRIKRIVLKRLKRNSEM